MAELIPIPLSLLLRRAFLEYRRHGAIFDLPKDKFFLGLPGLDTSVAIGERRAFTPIGPAAGPQGQLAQNIALCWLAGARIIELKTVQILDELEIPRPCIDIPNVGYNVEWSQELKLEQSAREYVKASMLIEILSESKLLGQTPPGWGDTIFDMSVGYSLEGVRSPRTRQWLESMKNASALVDDLRSELHGAFAAWRDLPFVTRIGDTATLSTFHGCPPREIEGIVSFLLTEMDLNVCVKLNPTLLGQREVEFLLYDKLGYREIVLSPEAFEKDLQWDEALDLISGLDRLARSRGRRLSVKLTNTLVVQNHRAVFGDRRMYLSGAPLHVLAMALVKRIRERLGVRIPLSFSAGLDANNVADVVAMNLVPATSCTDLLRPGGYARLHKYMQNLGAKMREIGAATIGEYIVRRAQEGGGQAPVFDAEGPEAVAAGTLINTARLADAAVANPRYAFERNRTAPRKLGSRLTLFDCIDCEKCVSVCPNDANFIYHARWPGREADRTKGQPAFAIQYENYEAGPDGLRAIPGGVFTILKSRQYANYADACNDCGNCDVFCPEAGGPFLEKPRFFGSLESFRKSAGNNGFFIDWRSHTVHGVIAGRAYTLRVDAGPGLAWFENAELRAEIRWSDDRLLQVGQALSPANPAPEALPLRLDMLPYLQLKFLYQSIGDPSEVNFVNAAELQESVR